ncbi:Gfo/Idh/MocA family protein [Sphingomonas sp. Mn802worker]|uniref:Gfo/Idh/MocA family protein n=1 Tax=Sphingomonas sp. Mn802worker TaxID=629773 RepID=UPI0003628FE1|nr:Gfo/Idh/MocA family oxidoreductase [Sphingomonas sp. Mn802worker]
MNQVRLGLVGIGKIARDQHLPAIASVAAFDLAATASRAAQVDGIDAYPSIEAMLAARGDLAAVSLCTPPSGRVDQALAALRAGKHVMLEKPPAATVSEVALLDKVARDVGLTLFTTWHSREAAAVDTARDWLAGKRIRAVRIDWKEDIRKWHPGQEWIMAAGGFGVFDPAINALSIATRILPHALLVSAATLAVPANRVSPIAATVRMRCGDAPVEVSLDFLQTGPQQWDIGVDTEAGTLALRDGGRTIALPGTTATTGQNEEYARLYRRFADLIATGQSDVDVSPLQLVADAFLVAERKTVEPFDF